MSHNVEGEKSLDEKKVHWVVHKEENTPQYAASLENTSFDIMIFKLFRACPFKEVCQFQITVKKLSLSASWVHISPQFSWTFWCHFLILRCLGLLGSYDVHSLENIFFWWKHWQAFSAAHNVPTLSWDTIKSRFALTKLGKPGESLFIFIV